MSTTQRTPSTGTGGIRARKNSKGTTFEIRFRLADGTRVSEVVGRSTDGTSRRDAEHLLRIRLGEVAAGTWCDPRAEPEPEEAGAPTLHEVVSEWLKVNRIKVVLGEDGRRVVSSSRLGQSTAANIDRALVSALWTFADPLPGGERASWPVDRLTARDVRGWLVQMMETGVPRPPDPDAPAARPVSAGTARRIGQSLVRVLDQAVQDEDVHRNVAEGPVRALRPERVRKAAVERAEHVEALLAAASRLDARAAGGVDHRRAFISTLTFTGARISEVLALRWSDVDLAGGSVRVRGTKTDAADRWAELLPRLRDDLLDLRARRVPRPEHRVFPTATGTVQRKDNARRRWFEQTVEEANRSLLAAGETPIATVGPGRITPHSLRRTFVTVAVAAGWDLGRVMDHVGHASVAMSLEVYRRQVNRRDGSLERLVAVYLPHAETGPAHTDRAVRL